MIRALYSILYFRMPSSAVYLHRYIKTLLRTHVRFKVIDKKGYCSFQGSRLGLTMEIFLEARSITTAKKKLANVCYRVWK